MITIFMVGLGAALIAMIVGIGLALSKDVTDLMDFGYDPTNGPRRG